MTQIAPGVYSMKQNKGGHRMADLEAEVVAVGHGDPVTGGAAERLRSLI